MKQQKIQVLTVHPHSLLRTECNKVEEFDEILQKKIELMFGVMRRAKGIGIAANQCFLKDRIFIATINKEPKVFINPYLINMHAGKMDSKEGCLSVPNVFDVVEREQKIHLAWQDEQGEQQSDVFEFHDAIVIQHELDHLNGRLFCDKLSSLKQVMIKRKMLKLKKKYGWI